MAERVTTRLAEMAGLAGDDHVNMCEADANRLRALEMLGRSIQLFGDKNTIVIEDDASPVVEQELADKLKKAFASTG